MIPAPAPAAFASTPTQVAQSWTCVILGAPRPKKTSQRIARTAEGKPFILQSVAQTAWAQAARLQVQAAWGGMPPLTCRVNVAAVFYRERNAGDLDNLMAGLLDVLQPERRRRRGAPAAGAVLANDRQVVSHDGSRLDKDAQHPRVEVTVHWAVPVERQRLLKQHERGGDRAASDVAVDPSEAKARRQPRSDGGGQIMERRRSSVASGVLPGEKSSRLPGEVGTAACATCGGQRIVASRWPSGYPHATPCPECRPGVSCDCGSAERCPSADAIETWKRERGSATATAAPALTEEPCAACERTHVPGAKCALTPALAAWELAEQRPGFERALLRGSRERGDKEALINRAGVSPEDGGHVWSMYSIDQLAARCRRGCGAWITTYVAGAPSGVDPLGPCPGPRKEVARDAV